MAYYNDPNNYGSPDYMQTSTFDETDWDRADSKFDDFLFDSPQADPRPLPDQFGNNPHASNLQNPTFYTSNSNRSSQPARPIEQVQRQTIKSNKPPAALAMPNSNFTAASSSSDGSEHSSSASNSSAQLKCKSSSTPTPPDLLREPSAIDDEAHSSAYDLEHVYSSGESMYGYANASLPLAGVGTGSLTLNTSAQGLSSTDFRSVSNSPEFSSGFLSKNQQEFAARNFGSLNSFSNNHSPGMTVQPSKTTLPMHQSGESSPLLASHESSPGAYLNTGSPYNSSSGDILGIAFSNLSSANGIQSAASSPMKMETSSPTSTTKTSKQSGNKVDHGAKWPCRLVVSGTPEKSRVETQIPIELTLHDAPKGITRIHLPSHTISKPKFQSKPPHEPTPDVLELSVMLVCASAMEKEGLEGRAFERAAADEIFVQSEENQPASMKGQSDDSDPCKPLNGGPVAICSGCITRERKRAARKKTKKQDEEDEWAKDEAKRVIVFNCAEVRDWCVVESKDMPVKDFDGPVKGLYMKAPMRIACYCRHQSEKVGFQVLFTIRTPQGRILAQAISPSVMITDDHKQPAANQPHQSMMYQQGMGNGQLYHGYPMMNEYSQQMPFRTSWSTNDLASLNFNNRNQYAPQRHPPAFSRHSSTFGGSTVASTATSTATATPRNLSRPASPTNESGPSKKRRAGSGGHSQSKIPTGLMMTASRPEGFSPTSAPPQQGGQMKNNYNYGYGPIGNQFPPQSPNDFSSGPPTPQNGAAMMNNSNFGGPMDGSDMPFTFFSAPTSQHPSRAPSPASAARAHSKFANEMQQLEHAPSALSRLPPGFNLARPPIIQKVIPNRGRLSGGEDVTILGTGFFQGLEVMFGDNACEHIIYWGETTLQCKVPRSVDERQVAVVFKHQHHNYSKELLQLRTIMPTTQVLYTYLDDERERNFGMQQLAMGMGTMGMDQSLGR